MSSSPSSSLSPSSSSLLSLPSPPLTRRTDESRNHRCYLILTTAITVIAIISTIMPYHHSSPHAR
ncbi:hypothetical protein E2C01_073670 [Portunus trituberculatus]|uniref:Transmembrane protein n=1 Tax=Portunus trituberculatus TaxID=210409 RepID=A0A5B7ICC1_PORTR|nr:hypothetical protein [Portunus trituberculatus]